VRTGGEPARLVLAPQPGVRVVLLGLLGVSSGFFLVMLLRGQLPPSLALHAAAGGRHRSHAGVFPRAGVPRALAQGPQQLRGEVRSVLLLSAGYVLFALLAIDRAEPAARLAATIGGVPARSCCTSPDLHHAAG
jgi:uncharacterized protein